MKLTQNIILFMVIALLSACGSGGETSFDEAGAGSGEIKGDLPVQVASEVVEVTVTDALKEEAVAALVASDWAETSVSEVNDENLTSKVIQDIIDPQDLESILGSVGISLKKQKTVNVNKTIFGSLGGFVIITGTIVTDNKLEYPHSKTFNLTANYINYQTNTFSINGSVSWSGSVQETGPNNSTYTYETNGAYSIFSGGKSFTVASKTIIEGKVVDGKNTYTGTYEFADENGKKVSGTFTETKSESKVTYTITANAGANGAVSPSGEILIAEGKDATFQIKPADGFEIDFVVVDGSNIGSVSSHTFKNITDNHSISANFKIKNYSISAASDGNGQISPAGDTIVNHGSSQLISFIPNSGYEIDSILVDGIAVAKNISYLFSEISNSHTIKITYRIKTHTVLVTAEANGVVSDAGINVIDEGISKTFSFAPAEGYEVDTLTVDGNVITSAISHTLTNISADHTIAVTFKLKSTNDITASAGVNGSISNAGVSSVTYGDDKTYSFTPSDGYEVAALTVDGVVVPVATNYTFANVTAAHSIVVTFKLKTYVITASSGAHGTISNKGANSITHGGSKSFSFTPEAGYEIDKLSVDGSAIANSSNYNFTNVTGGHTIAVTFKLKVYDVVASAGSNGTISDVGISKVSHGSDKSYTITPSVGYEVDELSVDGSVIADSTSHNFTNVTVGHTIAVTFKLKVYVVVASSGANGTISDEGALKVSHGSDKTFGFGANTGYELATLTVDGVVIANAANYTFTNVTAPHTIAATFKLKTYEIVASVGANGIISDVGTLIVSHGSDKTYNIIPSAGYEVDDLTVDGSVIADSNSHTFTNVTADHTIAVTFKLKTYAIAITSDSNGSITYEDSLLVSHGSDKTFGFSANTGYELATLTVDGAVIANAANYTFTNVTAPHAIAVTWALIPTPSISSMVANDADDADAVYSNGDTITIIYSENTNQPSGANKVELDALYSFAQTLGADYTGNWTDAATHVITVVDATGATPPIIGSLKITVKSNGGLKNLAGTSLASTSESPVITGNWGLLAGPVISSIVADDADGGDLVYGVGDAITVHYNENTNQVTGNTKLAIDALYTFTASLGADYTGTWSDAQTHVITIVDAGGATPPEIGSLQLTLKSSGNLKNASNTSLPSISQSPVITGIWGLKAPTNVVAIARDGKVELTWAAVTGAVSYKIYWSTNSPVSTSDTEIINATSGHLHLSVTIGTAYYYTVVAVNSVGESSLSSEVSATPYQMPSFNPKKWTTFNTANTSSTLANNEVKVIYEDNAGNKWFGTGGGLSKFDGNIWTTYTTSDGLASDNITSIIEDSGGNLWFGTSGGVSKFDGSIWTTYRSADGLVSSYVGSVEEDSSGNFWFGTNGGVSKFDGSIWTTYTTTDGLASNYIYSTEKDTSGNLWFGTSNGVSKFDGSIWTTFTTTDGLAGNSVYSIKEDSLGNLWFGTNGGVSKFDGSIWTTYAVAVALSIEEDVSGNLWFGTNGGVSKFDGSIWTTYYTSHGLVHNYVNSIKEDSLGNLWFGTRGGVSRFDGSIWMTYRTMNGLVNNTVNAIKEDVSGNLWFGTGNIAVGGGVSKFDGSAWAIYSTVDGLANNAVRAIIQDVAGNLWFGTLGGVSKFDGSAWTTYTTTDGLAHNSVYSIKEDISGNLWFGTYNGGVSKFDGSIWTTYTTEDGLANDSVYSIEEDVLGNLWFGTNNGVSKYDGSVWRTYRTTDGLANNSVHSILEDTAGNLWFGTNNGVSKYDGSIWRTYTVSEGLTHNFVISIEEDASGNLWFGTGGDVSKYDGSVWTTYARADGLSGNSVASIKEDVYGNIWLGTGIGGISKLTQEILGADSVVVDWSDTNSQSTYTIDLYYDADDNGFDGALIVSGIDESDTANSYIWDTSALAIGSYYVYMVFSNGVNTEKVYLEPKVTIKAGPAIKSVIANDVDAGDLVYGVGDTITITYSENTNQIAGATKAEIDALYTFSASLGADYTGVWLDAKTHVITIVDATGATPPAIDSLQITVKESADLKNTAGTSLISTSVSPTTTGFWGLASPANVVASAQDNKIELKWDTVSNAASYNIYWSTSPSVSTSDAKITNAVSPYLHTSLTVGLQYYYIIVAVNPAGESPLSSEVSATPYQMPTFSLKEWKTFNTANTSSTLANNLVFVVYEDSSGNKWFGTQGGVSKFDGSSWVNYTTADGLVNNDVRSIFEDSSGAVWFGTYGGGVSKFFGNVWTTYTTSDGLANNYVSSIVEDSGGNLWLGTQGGVSKFDGSAWVNYTTVDGLVHNNISSIFEASNGDLWFGGGGVSKFSGNVWTTYTTSDGLVHNGVRSVLEDSNGDFWFATYGGVSKLSGNVWSTYTTSNGLASNNVISILEGSGGALWFSTNGGGASKFDGNVWKTYSTSDGLVGNYVWQVLEDSSGSFWFGTNAGVSKLSGNVWLTYTTSDGFAGNRVYSTVEDSSGDLWFGTSGGVSKFSGNVWTTYTTSDGLASNVVTSVFEDSSGALWFGTSSGVSKFSGNVWTTYTTSDGLASNNVTSILEDSGGALWFSTNTNGTGNIGGVSKFSGNVWTTYRTSDGLVSNFVTSMVEDSSGALWFGTYSGVSKFAGNVWMTYSTSDGLASNVVFSIEKDSAGALWFGTNGGVSKYDGTSWVTFNTSDGLVNNVVHSIFESNNGDIWFGTSGGVSKYDGTSWVTFNTSDGLANNIVFSVFESSNGNLWFGTNGGGVSKYSSDITVNSSYQIKWQDLDSQSNYTLSFYYDTDKAGFDGGVISEGILEANSTNSYTWDISGSGLPPDTYYIYIVFTDGNGNTEKIYLDVAVTSEN